MMVAAFLFGISCSESGDEARIMSERLCTIEVANEIILCKAVGECEAANISSRSSSQVRNQEKSGIAKCDLTRGPMPFCSNVRSDLAIKPLPPFVKQEGCSEKPERLTHMSE